MSQIIAEQWIPVASLRPSPNNPRLFMREERIERIAGQMREAGYDPKFPILVRPLGDVFEVIDGHHRLTAATAAGIPAALAKVVELDDVEALEAQFPSNDQDGWLPLEIGIGFLRLEDVSSVGAGRGNSGGIRGFAKRRGISNTYAQECINAARVYLYCLGKMTAQAVIFSDKTKHLSAIHSLPRECWPDAVQTMLDKGWSAKETGEQVKAASDAGSAKVICALLAGRTSLREIERINETRERVAASFEYDETRATWAAWFAEADPIDIKEVQAKRIELEGQEYERREAERVAAQKPAPTLPNLVLADPPWRYDFAETDSRQIENQYPSATVDEIISHKPDTEQDCVLLMWATVAKLREAFEVMDGWGFEYKTHAVWDKEKIGMGYWFRGQHELLLVGTKGQASPPDAENRVSSVFREPRGKHSAKPQCVYEWIEAAFPERTKLEMYCRAPREGWAVFGNESA